MQPIASEELMVYPVSMRVNNAHSKIPHTSSVFPIPQSTERQLTLCESWTPVIECRFTPQASVAA